MNENKKITTYSMVLIALFTALLCLLAPFTIPLPGIPLSLAPFIIVLAGMTLGSRFAPLSVLLYLFLGFAGLPVFSNHQAGPGVLFGATGGFLIGYLLLAFFSGLGARKKTGFSILFIVLGMAACYIPGIISLRIVTMSWNAVVGLPLLFIKDLAGGIAGVFTGKIIMSRISHVIYRSKLDC